MKTMMLMMGLLVSTAAFAAPGGRGGFDQGRQGDRVGHGERNESRRGEERRGGDERRGDDRRRDDDRREGRGHDCGRFGRDFGHRR
jgi:hypothetical protein